MEVSFGILCSFGYQFRNVFNKLKANLVKSV